MVDIFALSVALFFSFRRIHEPSKVTANHSKIAATLTELLIIINVIRLLLNQIARKVVYTHALDEKVIDSAYNRYWNEINILYNNISQLRSKTEAFKQNEISSNLAAVLKHLFETIEFARSVKPDQDHIFPDTKILKEQVDTLDKEYIRLLSSCDHYVKTDQIARSSAESIMSLVYKK